MGLIRLKTGSKPGGVSIKCEAFMRKGIACSEYCDNLRIVPGLA